MSNKSGFSLPEAVCCAGIVLFLMSAVPRAGLAAASSNSPPSAPAGVSASDGTFTDRVRIIWDAASNAASYSVWISTVNDVNAADRMQLVTTASCDDTAAADGVIYYYWVKAKNAYGSSEYSAPDTGYRGRETMEPPARVIASTNLTGKISVTWDAVVDAAKYTVWRNTANDVFTASLIKETQALGFYDETVEPEVPYYYWVRTMGESGTSRFSMTAVGWCLGSFRAPEIPVHISASDGTYVSKIVVTWSNAADAAAYVVRRSCSNVLDMAINLGVFIGNTIVDDTAVPGVVYYYWVQATNNIGISGFGLPDSGWCRSAELNAPTGVTASSGLYSAGILITWQAVNGTSHYEIWRYRTDNCYQAVKMADITENFWLDQSAAFDTPYYYWVVSRTASASSDFSSSSCGARHSHVSHDYDGDARSDLALYNSATAKWYVWSSLLNTLIVDGAQLGVPAETTALPSVPEACSSFSFQNQRYFQALMARASSAGIVEPPPDPPDPTPPEDPDVPGEEDDDRPPPSPREDTLPQDPGSMPMDGDYDGDGISEIIAYHAASSNWVSWVWYSGNALSINFGGSDYEAVQGDFDGDRRSDPAIYSKDLALWFIMSSYYSYNLYKLELFGGQGFENVTGDYDNDGITDPALYNELSGEWNVRLSDNGFNLATAVLGGPGWTAVPGDFDGDHKLDPGVYNRTTGEWVVTLSADNYNLAGVRMGGDDYLPVPGDFDGDDKCDPAVYQESTGTWLFMLSGSDYQTAAALFGGPDYKPVQ